MENKKSIAKTYKKSKNTPKKLKTPFLQKLINTPNKTFYLNPLGIYNENIIDTDSYGLILSISNNQIYHYLKTNENMNYSNIMPVDYIYIYGESIYDRNKFDSKQSRMISLLSGPSKYKLTNKINFTKLFINEPFIYPSIIINRNYLFNKESHESFLKIIKPDGGFNSEGIQIVKNNQEILQYLKNANEKYNNFILQDYIIKPDLFEGLKFVLRASIMVRVINKIVSIYYCKYLIYYVSFDKFKLDDFNNKNIHTPEFYRPLIFPNTIPDNYTNNDIKIINNKIITYLKTMFKNNLNFKPAWNAINGFEIFGLDLIFSNKQPYFLELNEKVGKITYMYNTMCIPNYIKSVLELTYLEKNYDKYNNFIKIK